METIKLFYAEIIKENDIFMYEKSKPLLGKETKKNIV